MVSEAQKRASVKYQEKKMVARTIKGSSPAYAGNTGILNQRQEKPGLVAGANSLALLF